MTKTIHKHKLPLVWGVALLLTLLQAVIWQAITPPWTAPDEPGHYLFVRLYAESGHPPTPEDITPAHWNAILASLKQSGWQSYVHPSADQPAIAQDPMLAASGLQVGQKPPGYYALAAFWLRMLPQWRQHSPAEQLRWIRGLSLLLRLATVIAVLFLATRLWPDAPERILSLGLLVGLIPMVGFIGGSLNNDALTMLWGAVAFTALVLARSPAGWLLATSLILIGPLLVDVSLLFLWPLALGRWALFTRPARNLQLKPTSALRPRLLISIGVLLLLGILLLFPNPRRAAGWRWRGASHTRAAGQLSLSAQDAPARLIQTLSGKEILKRQGQTLMLAAQVTGQGGPLILQLDDGSRQSRLLCSLTPEPQTCRLTFTLSPGSQHISVSAFLPHGKTAFRAFLTDASGWELLDNGAGTRPAPLGDPLFIWLERHLPLPAGYFSRLLTPAIWDIPSLLRYGLYAGFTWASFWGYFGWLNRPYPWTTYLFLAAITLIAIIGLSRRLTRLINGRSSADDGILTFSLLTFLFILLQTWLPMLGHAWQPQGRYLFPALSSIVILLLLGWEIMLPPQRRRWLPPILFILLLFLNLQAWRIIRL